MKSKKTKPTSPTSRTNSFLRNAGWTPGIVEHWKELQPGQPGYKPGAGYRKDLWGFVDVIAVGPPGVKLIQCTSYSGISARVTKILTECREKLLPCLAASNVSVEVWGWREFPKPRHRRTWRPVVRYIVLDSAGHVQVHNIGDLAIVDGEIVAHQEDLPF